MAHVINAHVINDGIDGTVTAGRKGIPYDWQQFLIPEESEFNTELEELLDSSVASGSVESSIA
jgi:hypothetical protein